MIRRSGNKSVEELAAFMLENRYIEVYALTTDTAVSIPYLDVPTGKKKEVKFVKVLEQWVWVEEG